MQEIVEPNQWNDSCKLQRFSLIPNLKMAADNFWPSAKLKFDKKKLTKWNSFTKTELNVWQNFTESEFDDTKFDKYQIQGILKKSDMN